MLKRLGIVKSRRNKGYRVFMNHIEPDFINNTMGASEYVRYCWGKYEASGVDKSNALNGTIFELIIATLFVKERLVPLHLQARVAFVPNITFDAVLYTNESGPISLSLKTSLRERYKQADLEAIALKYVHRKAENYLLTMDSAEAESVSQKILSGDILGINKAVLTTDNEFDVFIEKLREKEFITPGKIDIISAVSIITPHLVEEAIRS